MNGDHDIRAVSSSVVAAARTVAEETPDRQAYIFLADGETESAIYDFGKLDAAVRRVGAWLQANGLAGQRVLLAIEPGEKYVTAFLGCLYAGTVAVPCYPPRPRAEARELATIAADCGAAAIAASTLTAPLVERLHQHNAIPVLNIDAAQSFREGQWREPQLSNQDLALLQYTSGSTGAPKGVMVRHGDILRHVHAIVSRLHIGHDTTAVSWLPPYHDMGLIAFVLLPAIVGLRCVMMSPMDFVAKPARWLTAITRYGGNASASPDFGYHLCAQRVPDEVLPTLDLSSWQWAGNGAEPVRTTTMRRFADRFTPVGFPRRAFSPCYGLAEATLAVTLAHEGTDPRELPGGVDDLTPVGCGEPLDGHRVAVVDPDAGTRCADGTEGEIWVSGPSLPQGYWNKPEQSTRTFQATLAGETDRYLRTGDMGIVRDGQVFVVGRYRDIIVVRGRNFAPSDIEHYAATVDPRARPGCGAAFTVTRGGVPQVVVVQEVATLAGTEDARQISNRIRERVLAETGLRVDVVALAAARSLPKTTSGKIQRHAVRARYLSGSLRLAENSAAAAPARPPASSGEANRLTAMETLLVEQLECVLTDGSQPSHTSSFADQGMDSVRCAAYVDNLSVLLGRDLRPQLLYEFPTVQELARHLVASG